MVYFSFSSVDGNQVAIFKKFGRVFDLEYCRDCLKKYHIFDLLYLMANPTNSTIPSPNEDGQANADFFTEAGPFTFPGDVRLHTESGTGGGVDQQQAQTSEAQQSEEERLQHVIDGGGEISLSDLGPEVINDASLDAEGKRQIVRRINQGLAEGIPLRKILEQLGFGITGENSEEAGGEASDEVAKELPEGRMDQFIEGVKAGVKAAMVKKRGGERDRTGEPMGVIASRRARRKASGITRLGTNRGPGRKTRAGNDVNKTGPKSSRMRNPMSTSVPTESIPSGEKAS
jgi:hypothetical protein